MLNLTITDVAEAPSGLSLSASDVDENSSTGTVVATLTGTDPEGGALTYAWVSGAGFTVVGDQLRVADALNHEAGATVDVVISVTDVQGNVNQFTRTITINDVAEAPAIQAFLNVSTVAIPESSIAGRSVGRVTVNDPDSGDSVSLSLIGPDAANFELDGLFLRVAAGAVFDFDTNPSLAVTVRATDLGGLFADQAFTINVLDVVSQQESVQAALGGNGASVGLTIVVTSDGPQLQRGGTTILLSGLTDLTIADGLLGFGTESTLAGVERLFLGLLGRSTTGTEMMDAKELLDRGQTLSDLANGLLNGAEFSSYVQGQTGQPDVASLSTGAFVELMYNRVLGRSSDGPGLAFWTSILDNGLVSRADVLLGFSNSGEGKTHFAANTQALWAADTQAYQVRSLYDVAFNREPDAGGLAFWSTLMDQQVLTIGQVADYLVQSPEFQLRIDGLSTGQVLAGFYQDGLERAADNDGLAYWTFVFDNGLADWSDVLVGFALSSEQGTQLESYRSGTDIFVS